MLQREKFARDAAFVMRCSGAATLSVLAAQAVGLAHPVWAAISALVVSQDRLGETREATIGRILGTLLGIVIAVVVGQTGQLLAIDVVPQIALSVLLAAIAARLRPSLKVCMWTCPIVLLTASPGTPLLQAGFDRGGEVFLGGVIGGLVHLFAEALIFKLFPPNRP